MTLDMRVQGLESNEIHKSYWFEAINWTHGMQTRILNKNGTNQGQIYKGNQLV